MCAVQANLHVVGRSLLNFGGSRSEETAAFTYASFYRRAQTGPAAANLLAAENGWRPGVGRLRLEGIEKSEDGWVSRRRRPLVVAEGSGHGGNGSGKPRCTTCLSVRCRAICQVFGFLGPGCFSIETWTVQSGNISSTVVLLGARWPCCWSAILNFALRASPIR